MASRFYTPPSRPSDPGDIHPSWCTCCGYEYDLAHRRRGRALLTGLLIAIVVAGVIAVLTTQVPA